MTDIHATIQSLLDKPDTLQRWELAIVKSAAGCDVIGVAQARVIRNIALKNYQN